MNLSKRTKISLVQFLRFLPNNTSKNLFEKYEINCKSAGDFVIFLEETIFQKNIEPNLEKLLEEIVQTQQYLTSNMPEKLERFNDLIKCFLTDALKVEKEEIKPCSGKIILNTINQFKSYIDEQEPQFKEDVANLKTFLINL